MEVPSANVDVEEWRAAPSPGSAVVGIVFVLGVHAALVLHLDSAVITLAVNLVLEKRKQSRAVRDWSFVGSVFSTV
jgi:hypothetical protein